MISIKDYSPPRTQARVTKGDLIRLAEGDERVYKEIEKIVFIPYALMLTRDDHSAEELIQETFLKILRYGLIQQYDPDRAEPSVYLGAIMKSVWNRMMRDANALKRGGSRSLDEIPKGATDKSAQRPDKLLVSRETRNRLRDLLKIGSHNEQQVGQLFYGNGIKIPQIVDALDMPEGSVRGYLSKFLGKVRVHLDGNIKPEDLAA